MKILEHNSSPHPVPNKVKLLDVSELWRPEAEFASKPVSNYRDYTIDEDDPIQQRVRQTYDEMHTNQTVDFVQAKRNKWLKFDTFKATIFEALTRLNELVDESDPDVDIPNIVHAFQTAERIRKDFPDQDWFHLTGLIHDLGKVMVFYGEPQWAVVGDTFPVGCNWGPSIVYRQTSFKNNKDGQNHLYNTKYGMYSPNCGLENVLMSWGHDEYLYQILRHNNTTLPKEALQMIRFHSFYPWHTAGDYEYLCNEGDNVMKEWVKQFNKYDLYTKGSEIPNIEELTPYYQSLVDKFIPGVLSW